MDLIDHNAYEGTNQPSGVVFVALAGIGTGGIELSSFDDKLVENAVSFDGSSCRLAY